MSNTYTAKNPVVNSGALSKIKQFLKVKVRSSLLSIPNFKLILIDAM